MKLAILSDSHDNLANIDIFLDYAKKNNIEELIHCGDVCAPSVLRYLSENFKGKIHLVFGNVDGDRFKMNSLVKETLENINLYGEMGEFELAGKKIAIVHFPDQARELAQSNKYDFVFYGHNHKPWEETIGKTRLINPGTLAGLFSKATFAVYDFDSDKLELKIVEKL